MNVGGVVLCGGESRRMGRCKAWLPIGGEVLLQRVVRTVAMVARPVVVAARVGQELPTLPSDVLIAHDAVENAGPMAGLNAAFALLESHCDAAAVVACDHPLLTAPFVAALIDLLDGHRAVVPVHEGRRYPLLAVYRLDVRREISQCLREASLNLDSGLRRNDLLRVQSLADRIGARFVDAETLREFDPRLDSLRNVNDAGEWKDIAGN